MTVTVLMGSPRPNGNTAQLLQPVIRTLTAEGHTAEVISLYDLHIEPCRACRRCQQVWDAFGCPQADDVPAIFERLLSGDLILLATPVYSWYCTPPMKALLDRLVYGMCKYYGEKKGPSLWAGKAVALVTTCGYPPEKGADLLEAGIRRYCKHGQLRYLGMLCEHDRGYTVPFMDAEKAVRAENFAKMLCRSL